MPFSKRKINSDLDETIYFDPLKIKKIVQENNQLDLETLEEDLEDIQVDFDFCDPLDDDYTTIHFLLKQSIYSHIPKLSPMLSDLSQNICLQKACGTTVKVENELFAFISALGGYNYSTNTFIRTIVSILEEKCPEPKRNQLLSVIQKQKFAWLIIERFINIPNQIISLLYQSIMKDIEWAQNNLKESDETIDMYDFEDFLFFSPCLFEDKNRINDEINEENLTKKKNRKKAKEFKILPSSQESSNQSPSNFDLKKVSFIRYEDEFLVQNAHIRFPIELDDPILKSIQAKDTVPQFCMAKHAYVCIISFKNLELAINIIKDITNQAC